MSSVCPLLITQISTSAFNGKSDSVQMIRCLYFFLGPSVTKTLRQQALARLLKHITVQLCKMVSILRQRGTNIMKPKPQVYFKYLTY